MTEKAGSGHKVILLVENDAVSRLDEARMLGGEGYEVITASTGEEAIETVRTTPGIDLILMVMDLGKGMDGTEAAQTILEDHDLPIVFLSSHTEKDVVEKTEKVTSYGYVVKDTGITVLNASIRMAFRLHEAHRKLAEKERALRDAELKARDLIDAVKESVWLFALDGTVLTGNATAAARLGAGLDQVIGKKEFTQIPHHITESRQLMIAEVGRTGAPLRFEDTFDNLSHEHNLYPVKDSGGRVVAVASFSRDVTERRRAENGLRESDNRLRSALASLHMGVWELNTATNKVFWSPECYEVFGSKDFDVTSETVMQFLHPDDVTPLMDTFRQLSTDHRTLRAEFRIIRSDGEVRWVANSAHASFDRAGVLLSVIGTVQDITERKQAEQKIAQLIAVVQSSPDSIVGTSLGGVITSWNKGAEGLYGYTESEAVGNSISLLVPPALAGERPQIIKKIRAGEQINNYETTRRRKNGEDFQVALAISPIRDAEGRVVAVSTVGRDITEKKRLLDQLAQARKLEAIGTLAGGIAHDFNNILMIIMGCTDAIQAEIGSNDPLRPHADQIMAASQKAADLTRRLLEFSREQPITLESHNLNDLVRNSAKLLERLLAGDIELKTDLADTNVIVRADVGQMEQVLMNLATNARDAMPGGGSLIIKTRAVTLGKAFHRTHGFGRPGRYVELSVSDSGRGMNRTTMERIFDPFFTTKEMGKGTGLGLASVYGTVKQHGGYITVSSEPDKGTSFRIYVPLVRNPRSREAAVTQEFRTGTETILIAEDDPNVRKVITGILEKSGYVIMQAVDGEDAIRVYQENKDRIDLVILDVVMPRKNGKEALDEIARISPCVKAIFMSGYAGDVVLGKATENESLTFVQKPVSALKLRSKVREVLDR